MYKHIQAHQFCLITCLTAAVSCGYAEVEILFEQAFHDSFNRITLPSQVKIQFPYQASYAAMRLSSKCLRHFPSITGEWALCEREDRHFQIIIAATDIENKARRGRWACKFSSYKPAGQLGAGCGHGQSLYLCNSNQRASVPAAAEALSAGPRGHVQKAASLWGQLSRWTLRLTPRPSASAASCTLHGRWPHTHARIFS